MLQINSGCPSEYIHKIRLLVTGSDFRLRLKLICLKLILDYTESCRLSSQDWLMLKNIYCCARSCRTISVRNYMQSNWTDSCSIERFGVFSAQHPVPLFRTGWHGMGVSSLSSTNVMDYKQSCKLLVFKVNYQIKVAQVNSPAIWSCV